MMEIFKNLNKCWDIPFLWIWRLNKSCSLVSTGNWSQDHPKIPKFEDAQVPCCRAKHTGGPLHSQISNHGSKILYIQTSDDWILIWKTHGYDRPTVVKILTSQNDLHSQHNTNLLFRRCKQMILELIWNSKETKIVKIIFKRPPPDFKTYQKATVDSDRKSRFRDRKSRSQKQIYINMAKWFITKMLKQFSEIIKTFLF